MASREDDRLVGRGAELETLNQILRTVRAGRPQFVVMAGETGVGTTAVLRSFLERTSEAVVLRGNCAEELRTLEYGLIDQLWTCLPPTISAHHKRTRSSDSIAVGAELLTVIGILGQGRPVIIGIDDLQWIDSSSARALTFAVRRLRREPVLIIGSGREDELKRLGPRWSGLFADADLFSAIEMTGITADHVRGLAAAKGHPVTAHVADRLRSHTGGNPLHLLSLLEEVPQGQTLTESNTLAAPRTYALIILTRLAGLSPQTRDFVVATAVLGNHASLRTAAAIAETDEAFAVADEAEACGILRRTGSGINGSVRFVHPLARSVIYDDLPATERRSLHRKAAEALGSPMSLHHLVAAANGVDGQLAIRLRAQATHEMSHGSLLQAAKYRELASDVEPDSRLSKDDLLHAVELLHIVGDANEIRMLKDRLLSFLEDQPPYEGWSREEGQPSPGSLSRRYAVALFDLAHGDPNDVVGQLTDLTECESVLDQPALLNRIASRLAALHSTLGNDEQAIRWAKAVLAAPEHVGATGGFLAREALAFGYARTGRAAEAFAVLAGVGNTAPVVLDVVLLSARGVIRNWFGHAGAVDDLRVVNRRIRGGAALSDAMLVLVNAALAETEFRSGNWSTVVRHIELAISLGEDLDLRWHMAYAHHVAAHIHAVCGRRRFATANAASARSLSQGGQDLDDGAYAALAAVHCAWAASDWECVEEALQHFARTSQPWVDLPNFSIWRFRLAESLIAQNRANEALDLLDHATRALGWGGTCETETIRLRALALHRSGATSSALRTCSPASNQIQNPETFSDALLAADYGRILVEIGDGDASVPLHAASQVFERLGAVPFRQKCDSLIRRAGIAGSPPAMRHPNAFESLTAREQVVARLVAEGASNREVAAELYLSVKGVEFHLSNIFVKLGISSRRRIRAFVVRAVDPDGTAVRTNTEDGPEP